MKTVTIEPLDRTLVDETARTLARAFDDSPLFQFLFPKGTARLRIMAGTFKGTMIDALAFGQIQVAKDETAVTGAACWLPPEGYPITPWRQTLLLARMATLFPHAPTRVGDAMRYLAASDKVHPKTMHWYLGILGVDPRYQGKGVGARLIDHTLERLDREGLPAYLETDKESNLAWYARRRFELRETLSPVRSGPPIWTMWRDPA
ncbi:MAG: GNAT family N-acetyltransferase [Acidimicrobiia bacterium]